MPSAAPADTLQSDRRDRRRAVIDTLTLLDRLPTERPKEYPLDDLLTSWGELSADPGAVAALGQIGPELEARIAMLEAQIGAALPPELQATYSELLALHRRRADDWGFSGVEYARRALVALLR
jgi:hypothetical protein